MDNNYTENNVIFTEKDRDKTILIPWFTDFLSPLIPPVAKIAGYNFVNCPKTSKRSADIGLKYGNNEVCYPATLILGDLISEIESGKHNIDNLAVAITQTGGQCRATNYLSFIKRGLKNAGYDKIPIISVALGDVHQNEQPGFRLPVRKIFNIGLYGFLFGDALNQIYSVAKVRAKKHGEAQYLFDFYMQKAVEIASTNNHKAFLLLLKQAVEAFNKIATADRTIQKIGLIGEIFVKYNDYGQSNIKKWLQDEGFEVIVPPMIDFFMQTFINQKVNTKNGIRKSNFLQKTKLRLFYSFLKRKTGYFDKILQQSKFYNPHQGIFEISRYAGEIIDLSNQFGEGWLVAGDIAHFSHQGINRVVCVQPFGCIANHIVAKGIERRIKQLYPSMNLLFLDIDGGMAEVNLHNRLRFLIN